MSESLPLVEHAVIVGPITINLIAERRYTTISINGKSVAFTPLQREMLSFLAEHANGWVSKAELYKEMWENPRPDPKILDVFLCNIRKKISQALDEQPPPNSHYLIGDLSGNYGLFSEIRPMMRGRPHGHPGVGRELRELQFT